VRLGIGAGLVVSGGANVVRVITFEIALTFGTSSRVLTANQYWVEGVSPVIVRFSIVPGGAGNLTPDQLVAVPKFPAVIGKVA
jgi:hypothetical protein